MHTQYPNHVKGWTWPLKLAVSYSRTPALLEILARFPGVNFDLVHPKYNLAEPLSLSLNEDSSAEVRELVHLTESHVQSYYKLLEAQLRLKLTETLPLVRIDFVVAYSARMPLSPTFLEK
jgi:hypothetical protein